MTARDQSPRPQPRWRRARYRLAMALLVVAALLAPPTVSLGRALTAPGAASWQVRTVDWLRDHGGASAINAAENWYYSRRAPADGPPDPSALPAPAPGGGARTQPPQGPSRPARLPVLPGRRPVPGEARWLPGRTDAAGIPLIYTGFFRPDPSHASVVAGVAWIRQSGTAAHLVAGTVQPGGRWPGTASVPGSDRLSLLATFNSGWRMKDIGGGFSLNGRSGPPLADGQATAAIDDRGRLTVGQWGRDLVGGPHLVAARQNLELIVDNGRPVPGMASNAHGQWGSAKNQFQYTSRSGLGVDRNGNLIYVAGTDMNLDTLAAALVGAGAFRGMELDIHSGLTFFASYRTLAGGTPQPVKLLPTMTRPADRYLVPDQRDFFYLTVGAGRSARAQ